MYGSKNRIWIEGAMAAALAMALSFVPVKFGPGFSISLGMIAIVLYSLRRGFVPGLFSGLTWGLLHFLLGKASVFSVPQALIEYVFAYLAVGMAGVVSSYFKQALSQKKMKKTSLYLTLSIVISILSRYLFHFIAGVIFWGSYAPDGMSPVVYSLFLNGSNAVLTGIVTWIALFLLLRKSPKLFLPDAR